jgi:Ser/Thr protein kinase RdoA (MazF antagonist)
VSSSDDWHRSRAPAASLDFLQALVERHWGFNPALKPLYGERDLNARLLTPSGERWLLKLSHPDSTAARLAVEQRVFEGLAAQHRSPVTPCLLPSRQGTPTVPVVLEDGRPSHLRILSWLPGEPLDVPNASGPALESLGRACAQLNEALAACELSEFAAALPRNLPWDLQNAGALAALLERCPPVVPRESVLRTLDTFQAGVAAALTGLPQQVVHNALNPDNLRFDPHRPSALPGVIDFGDMVVAPVICDLAIACAYLVGESPDSCLDRVALTLRGFNQLRPLESTEWAILPVLLEARLCQSLTIQGARISDAHPDAAALEEALRGHARRLLALQNCGKDSWARLRDAIQAQKP